MKNGKRAVRKSSVILKGQPPVDPDKNRQALDSRGGFDFYIYKRNAVLLYFILQEKAIIKELCGAMLKLLIKPYECHMIDFLCDAGNYFEMTQDDFAPWKGWVLLILSEDDSIFSQACKDVLSVIMQHPDVVTNLTGGHLAMFE